jgi:hypothetical protein
MGQLSTQILLRAAVTPTATTRSYLRIRPRHLPEGPDPIPGWLLVVDQTSSPDLLRVDPVPPTPQEKPVGTLVESRVQKADLENMGSQKQSPEGREFIERVAAEADLLNGSTRIRRVGQEDDREDD